MDKTILQKDLFLGTSELNQSFNGLNDYTKNFIKTIAQTFGLMYNSNFPNCFNIIQGTTNNYITLQAGIAIDKNYNIIKSSSDYVNIASVPSDNVLRYVIISLLTTNIETGTVTIGTDGLVTGTNTTFTKFRGGNFPQRIKFYSNNNNAGDGYEITSILNDNQLYVNGSSFIAESGIQFKIFGTFTQGISITNKEVFSYDTPQLRLSTTNTHTSDTEFLLASVQNNGVTLTITDLRSEYFTTMGYYTDTDIQILVDKINIGIASSKWIILHGGDSYLSETIWNVVGSYDSPGFSVPFTNLKPLSFKRIDKTKLWISGSFQLTAPVESNTPIFTLQNGYIPIYSFYGTVSPNYIFDFFVDHSGVVVITTHNGVDITESGSYTINAIIPLD